MRELASGIDALYLSGRALVPGWFLDGLEGARRAADKAGDGQPVWIGSTEFEVVPHGFGRYRYCLVHENGQIGVTPSDRLPAFRIQPRAAFVHGVGATEASRWFADVLATDCGAIELTVSRMDLHADFQGWVVTGEDRRNFVCRARFTGAL